MESHSLWPPAHPGRGPVSCPCHLCLAAPRLREYHEKSSDYRNRRLGRFVNSDPPSPCTVSWISICTFRRTPCSWPGLRESPQLPSTPLGAIRQPAASWGRPSACRGSVSEIVEACSLRISAPAMRQVRYEIVEDDGSFYGDIPAIPGVWANDKTLEACREEWRDGCSSALPITPRFPTLTASALRSAKSLECLPLLQSKGRT